MNSDLKAQLHDLTFTGAKVQYHFLAFLLVAVHESSHVSSAISSIETFTFINMLQFWF